MHDEEKQHHPDILELLTESVFGVHSSSIQYGNVDDIARL